MKARHRKPRRSRRGFPFFFIGTIGTMGALMAAPGAHAAGRLAGLPVERRVTIEPARMSLVMTMEGMFCPARRGVEIVVA